MLIHNYATPECFVGVVLSLVSGGRAARWCTHHKKRQIQSITISTVSAHPSATLELLPYSLTISQQYDGLLWRSYDINYRVAAAASANQKWLRLDTDLVTRFFTGRARSINPCYVYDSFSQRLCRLPHGPKQDHSQTRAPQSTTPPFKKRRMFLETWESDICAEFNAREGARTVKDESSGTCGPSVGWPFPGSFCLE